MIVNILLALVSLLSDSAPQKDYLVTLGKMQRTDIYDFMCDGLYYEFAGENEVNLIRKKSIYIGYEWQIPRDILRDEAYDDLGNVCYVGDLVIPDSVVHQGKKYKVASVNQYALSYSRGLKSITFTSDISVQYTSTPQFESGALVHTRHLSNITYFDSTTTISRQLHRCPMLNTVHFPYKLNKIECSFVDCGLTEVDMDNHGAYNPDCFTIDRSFVDLWALRKVKFPECDTLLLSSCYFGGCPNVEQFVFRPCSVIIQEGSEFIITANHESNIRIKVVSESVTPPNVILRNPNYDNSFSKYNRSSNILYVPDESLEAYRAAEYWKDFYYLRPISEYYALEMVEIESPVADAENVSEILLDSKGTELHISVSEPTEVSVWSIQGAQVWRGRVADDTTLSLPHGMYIITTPTSTMKYSH
ncbi:MAG: leucine-rich repeat domain-containing protein [Paramuribaculum sp.]|nr:leucine-rich repeat domain-containing protein [Paramuribaculum sp.]